uniref:Uncharacterized protein n=1 Tax=Neogobius melanostomus TaxID=47308 RepID=A0A8C6TKL4_9GOBI
EEADPGVELSVSRRSLRQKVQDAVGLCLRAPRVRAPGSKRRVHSELRDGPLKSERNHWDLDQNLNQIIHLIFHWTIPNLHLSSPGNSPLTWTDPCSPGPALSEHPSSCSDPPDSAGVPVLVPDLLQISNSSCYWGVLDRFEAEALLDGAPEGTFLLRDSTHSQVLFSVSFRRYSRSLHTRIEQSGHVVGGLLRHYSDPHTCLFFEPLLAHPLPRTFPFSLQHLARCVICSCTTFTGLQTLPLPPHLKDYLTHYHLKT